MRIQDVPPASWASLREETGGRLVGVTDPLAAARRRPDGTEGRAALALAENPWALQDHPGAFQTTGWHRAFVSAPSAYAVAAHTGQDVAAAVRFAARHDLRVVVKGTGHDYLGRSSDPEALLIWTHPMRDVALHDAFRPQGSIGPAVPAVTIGAGTRWLEVYRATLARDRYAQGGGCVSVGAGGGFTLGGGCGSYTLRFGTAAGNLLQATVVTADGQLRVVNDHQHPDLFWALRGGGGGTFGVVVELTMRTHPAPETCGAVAGAVRASSDRAYRSLVRALVDLYPALDNPSWGELISLGDDNVMEFSTLALELAQDEMAAVWRPFLNWVDRHPGDYTNEVLVVAGLPFAQSWDADFFGQVAPGLIRRDNRPGQPAGQYWWEFNHGEVSWYLNTYQSRWLPLALFTGSPGELADALFRASRGGWFTLQVNKGLSGMHPAAVARDRRTAVHPAAFAAASLLIMVSCQKRRFPRLAGWQPDPQLAELGVRRVSEALRGIRELTPGAGSYLNEADYFDPDWKENSWGAHYPRLLEVKHRYDPDRRFRVHHGVGSDEPGPGTGC